MLGHTYDEIYSQYADIKDDIRGNIPKGEFRYFLAVEGYEKIGISALTRLFNGEKVQSVTQIANDIKGLFNVKDNLLKE